MSNNRLGELLVREKLISLTDVGVRYRLPRGGVRSIKEYVVLALRGQLRFLAKHHGLDEAERARRLLLAGVRARAAFFPAERRDAYRDAAGWLASSSAAALLRTGR